MTGFEGHTAISSCRIPRAGNAYAERLRRGNREDGPKLVETDMDQISTTIRQTRTGWTSICSRCGRSAKRRQALLAIHCLRIPAGGDFSFRPGSPALDLGDRTAEYFNKWGAWLICRRTSVTNEKHVAVIERDEMT